MKKCFDTSILLFDYNIKFHTRSPQSTQDYAPGLCFVMFCFLFISALCFYVVMINALVLQQTVRVLRFYQCHQGDSIQMNWVYLTIANAVTTKKQITENWDQTFWLLSITATENTSKLLWANLRGTDLMATDVGKYGCYDRLISTMGYPIRVSCRLYIEPGPWSFWGNSLMTNGTIT